MIKILRTTVDQRHGTSINRLAVAHQPATYVGNGSTHE